jgi:hypothetical protein
MDSNTHSSSRAGRLGALGAVVDGLADQDLDRLADGALAEQVLQLRRQLDRLEGQWLRTLAAVDTRGVAGAEEGVPAGSTASWLRARLRMGPGAAAGWVRTARALYRGPLTGTAQAWPTGPSPRPTPRCWPPAPTTSPTMSPPTPNRCWWRRPGGWTHPGCAGSWPICGWSPTPTTPTTRPNGATSSGGCGWPRPGRAWSRSTGCWTLRPARPCWWPWSRWPAHTTPTTPARVASAAPTPWPSWPAAPSEAGRLPQSGGVRPQLLVTVDLDSLLSHPGGLGGDTGGTDALDPRPAGGWPVTGR